MNRLEPVEPVTLQQRVHGAARPLTWHLDKLHRVLRVRRGIKNDGMKEDNLLSLSYGRIIPKDINTSEGLLPENFEGYQIVEPGNIVMRLTDLQNDKRSLRQGLVKERGIITSAYDALDVPKAQCPEFWFYSLLALDLAKHYYSLGGGVRQSVKFTDFPNDWIYLPDLTTQRQIAEFLDRETARIDLLIEKKQRMVERLGEKERGIRDTAILGSLTDAPRKPSGVDWIGPVPSHWTVCRFNRMISSKVDYRGRTPEKLDEGIFLVTARNIRDGRIDYDRSQEFTTQADWDALRARGEPEIGDVIFTTEAPMGQIAQVDRTDVAFAQRIMKFRANKALLTNDFLAEFMMSSTFQGSLQLYSSGSTAAGIKSERLAHLFGLVPPPEEQSQIVTHIRRGIMRLRTINAPVFDSITRLREYRSALITAAVTGQIDPTTHARGGFTDRQLDALQAEGAT